MRFIVSIILSLVVATAAQAANFTLKSNKFASGSMIPKQFTCDGGDSSPELHWLNAPAKTQSFVLIGQGLDSPMGKVYGWILYNIPAATNSLPEAATSLPDGTLVGKNSLGDSSYRGPCPPDGALHHYEFVLYAVDNTTDLGPDASVTDVMNAIKNHVIAQTTLELIYKH